MTVLNVVLKPEEVCDDDEVAVAVAVAVAVSAVSGVNTLVVAGD